MAADRHLRAQNGTGGSARDDAPDPNECAAQAVAVWGLMETGRCAPARSLALLTALVHSTVIVVSLLCRRTLRLLVSALLLAVLAGVAALLIAAGPLRWGWPVPVRLVGGSAGTAALYALMRPQLLRWTAYLLGPETYDLPAVVQQIVQELATPERPGVGHRMVSSLGATLDLGAAMLLSAETTALYWPRRSRLSALQTDALLEQARAVIAAAPPPEMWSERVEGVPVLFLPVRDGQCLRALLVLGPKRSGDGYTDQDQLLVRVVMQHLRLALWAGQPMASPPGETQNGSDQESWEKADCLVRSLTRQQRVVLGYLAEELTNEEIAAKMDRTTRTVEKHVTHILRTLGVQCRQEAVTIARQEHLLDDQARS